MKLYTLTSVMQYHRFSSLLSGGLEKQTGKVLIIMEGVGYF